MGAGVLDRIVLDRTATVPVRRQLAAALAAGIRDGPVLESTLPSTRELARALGVHRHTVAAAYRVLGRAGLVRSEVGRRVQVAAEPPVGTGRGPGGRTVRERRDGRPARRSAGRDPSPGGLAEPRGENGRAPEEALLEAYVRAARSEGLPARRVARALERARAGVLARRLLVVEPEEGLRRILAVEVSRAVPGPVEAVSPPALRRAPSPADGRLVLARAGVAGRLGRLLPEGALPFVLGCRGGTRELERVRALPQGEVALVLTTSPRVRGYVRELGAGVGGVAVAAPDPEDIQGVERGLRVARLVLADAWCARQPRLRGCRRVVEFRVLHPHSVRGLRSWLGIPPPEQEDA